MCIRYLAASNGDSSGDTSFRLSGRSSSSSSSDRSASGKNHPPLTRATSIGSNFVSQFFTFPTCTESMTNVQDWSPGLLTIQKSFDFLPTQYPSGRQNGMKHRNTYLYDLSFAVVFETPQALLLTPWRRSWSRGCRIPKLFHHLLGKLSCTTLLCHPVYREQLQVYGGNFSAEGRDTILNQLLPPLPFFNLQRHFLTSWNSP